MTADRIARQHIQCQLRMRHRERRQQALAHIRFVPWHDIIIKRQQSRRVIARYDEQAVRIHLPHLTHEMNQSLVRIPYTGHTAPCLFVIPQPVSDLRHHLVRIKTILLIRHKIRTMV